MRSAVREQKWRVPHEVEAQQGEVQSDEHEEQQSDSTTEAWWAVLTAILKSVRDRPLAWLAGLWICGWVLFGWHAIHPASWDSAWGAVNSFLWRAQNSGEQVYDPQGTVPWLQEVARWGQAVLYASTGLLALYVAYAIGVWWRYVYAWVPEVRRERLRGGRTLEVLIPMGSKADARAAADMFGQLWNLLTEMAGASGGFGPKKMGAERLALSLEMWSTPHTGGRVGFYIWCPAAPAEKPRDQSSAPPGTGSDHFTEEVRHLTRAYYPRSRVRWVDDPVKKALTDVTQAGRAGELVIVTSHELGLLAGSRYPIGSGASDERFANGSRSGSRFATRTESPGAGSDPLAAVIAMLATDKEVPVMGIQVVIAARAEGEKGGQTQQAVNKELARLREMEARTGRRALGPQHEARVMALEEKADRQGFDSVIRLVAVERIEGARTVAGADSRLGALFRKYRQYDRYIAGVKQGFQVVRRERTVLGAPRPAAHSGHGTQQGSLWRLGAILGRWPREGAGLPRLLPFMRTGKPCILNTVELSSVYHFPHQGLEGVSGVRWESYRHIPPPAEARVTSAQIAEGRKVMLGMLDDDLPAVDEASSHSALGPAAQTTNGGEGANVLPPGLRGVGTNYEDLRRGTYVLGPMGSGKSVLLYNMIVQHMAAGRGVGILDGKGDSYEEVLRLVPSHLEGEVLVFDPENSRGRGGSGGRSIGITPLDGRVVARLGVERVESLTMSLMKKMMGASWEQAVLMQRFLRDAITAVLQVEPMPTMLNLWRWLQDDGKGGNEYRDTRVGKIPNRLVQESWRQISAMSAQQRSSMQNVLTRVDRYVKSEVRYLLLQPYSTVDFQAIMDRGTIFVGRVSPRLGEDQSFLGALVLNGFLTGAFARQAIPQEQRRDYLLVVDEFQNFVDTARADVERMLSMARGYRLGLMLAHQYTDQLPKEVLSAILKNVQTWVVFGLQADDARRFAGYMEGLEPDDFRNLPPYYTYQRTVINNTSTGAYSAAPLPLPVPAANPGGGRGDAPEWERRERDRDMLRSAHIPDQVFELVHGEPQESEEARRERILKLARELYRPAEEGAPEATQVLSALSASDRELYRKARCNLLDIEERERLLTHPELIRDKAERIERLSALRWGTPRVEVEALILGTLRGGGYGSNGGSPAPAHPKSEPKIEPLKLSPDLDGVGEHMSDQDEC